LNKIGLIIEGGGFRGLFAEGITDCFLDHQLEFPYVIGVSMGASIGASYISKQKSRNYDVTMTFLQDPRYFGLKNLLTKGSLFGMDFIFDDIANKYKPFDFQSFKNSKQEMVIGAMNCLSGHTSYIRKSKSCNSELMDALKASISLPFVSQIAYINNIPHLDGGLSDPLPIKQAFLEGCDKVVIISTRDASYNKEPFKGLALCKLLYSKYPMVSETLKNRHLTYNASQSYMDQLAKAKKAYIIRPNEALPIGRLEKNLEKLQAVYKAGYQQGEKEITNLLAFITS